MNKVCVIAILILFSCNHTIYKEPHVRIKTDFGDIELELYPKKAPRSVAAFLGYIDSGYYNKSSFYRVLKADELPNDNNSGLVQGGIYLSAKNIQVPGIIHESTKMTGLSHIDGTVSFARKEAGSATTEFFICIGDQSPLDEGRRGTEDGLGMAAFGKVFKGMDVVRMIQAQASHGDAFDKKIEIKAIIKL